MRALIVTTLAALTIAACGATATPSSSATPTLTPATLSRPPTSVKITLVTPTNGEVVHGSTVHIVVVISGGTVTPTYSTHISPTVGHVHLYFDNQLVYMSYTLHQDLPVQPGFTYTMYAEWVAADHFPFSPRDVTPPVIFHVAAS
ncbi:MAG: hypothetical protein JOZ46_09270 [Candidatus Dormibacteraeota bacterium]|nr:hypothetical protein [Candidatus Dormibacteraeota bacterium]MBV9525988.1 hypothetical protein [Candidatus Dormibacteraeota bacterium]